MIALLTFMLGGLGPPQDDKQDPAKLSGECRVTVYQAAFNAEPNSMSDVVRKAKKGEKVTVLEVVKNGKQLWAKCKIDGDKIAYLPAGSLLTQKDFEAQSEGSEKEAEARAESYRGSRFDPATESEYSKEKNLGPAYESVNRWCGQPEAKDDKGAIVKPYKPGFPLWKNDRPSMLMQLRTFRREGKLGEFSGD